MFCSWSHSQRKAIIFDMNENILFIVLMHLNDLPFFPLAFLFSTWFFLLFPFIYWIKITMYRLISRFTYRLQQHWNQRQQNNLFLVQLNRAEQSLVIEIDDIIVGWKGRIVGGTHCVTHKIDSKFSDIHQSEWQQH